MPAPKHEKLRHTLEAEIRRKGMPPHAPFASEREIIARTGFSQPTVRHALGDLVDRGVLYRVQGKGTFIAPPAKHRTLLVASTLRGMSSSRSLGLTHFLTSLWEEPRVVEGPWLVQHMALGPEGARKVPEVEGPRAPQAVVVYRSMDLYLDLHAQLKDLPIPLLFYGSSAWMEGFTGRAALFVDEETIVRKVVEALVERGRRKIALCVDPERPVEKFRGELFTRLAKKAGLSITGVLPPAMGHEGFPSLVQGMDPDGIFATTDRLGAGILASLALAGVKVQGRISVISVDDYPFAKYLAPPLASVDPREDLGARAVMDWASAIPPGSMVTKGKTLKVLSFPELRKRASL